MNTPRDATRERLIEAGLAAFRAKGFEEASVREICSAAGANLAAVSYHFGGKEGLYRAILLRSFARHDAFLATMPRLSDHECDPLRGLNLWIAWNTQRLFAELDAEECVDLMHHELRKPSPLLDDVVREVMWPVQAELRAFLAAILERPFEDPHLEDLAIQISGMSLVYLLARPVLDRIDRWRGLDSRRDPERVAAVTQALLNHGLSALRGSTPE